jgi:hypothetical protein
LRLQQLESQKKQEECPSFSSNNIEIIMTDQNTINNQEITFQPITNDLGSNLDEQLQTIIKDKDSSFISIAPPTENMNVATRTLL